MKTENLTFGEAIEALKQVKVVCRKTWNSKDMAICFYHGNVDVSESQPTELITGIPHRLFVVGDKGTITRYPNLNMTDADGITMTGWVPSQIDMLAEDWYIVE